MPAIQFSVHLRTCTSLIYTETQMSKKNFSCFTELFSVPQEFGWFSFQKISPTSTPAKMCQRVRDFSVWPFRSGLFRSGDISIRLFKSCRNLICSHFNANILKAKRNLFKKNYKYESKIQQLISINIWFSLSSESKLNHHRHFAIKYKFFEVIITI